MHGILRVFGRMADTTRRAHIVNKPIYPWPPSSIQFISLHREPLPKASEANESVIVVLLHHYDWACVRFSFRFLFTRVVAVVPFHFTSIRFLSTAAVEAFFSLKWKSPSRAASERRRRWWWRWFLLAIGNALQTSLQFLKKNRSRLHGVVFESSSSWNSKHPHNWGSESSE